MGVIYGLYSTREAAVRYIGQTEYTARKSLDLIMTKALDRESGALYDWVRDEWRQGFDIKHYVLQDEVIPADLEMFERYWIEQFTALLNTELSADQRRATTNTGRQVNLTIQTLLKGEDKIPERR